MRQQLIQLSSIICLLLLLFACGGGSSDVSGVGGTGGQTYGDNGIGGSGSPYASATPVTSTGTITGFGSIFVNGVEFFTTDAKVEIDDNKNALDNDLKLGMVVTVNGEINTDGKTGTATLVETEYEIMGVLENIDPPTKAPIDPSITIRTFEIQGNTISIDRNGTVFHGQGVGSTFDFDTIDNGDYVRMSGYTDNSGIVLATHIEDLGPVTGDVKIILKGFVKNLVTDSSFDLLFYDQKTTREVFYDLSTDIIQSEAGINEIVNDVHVKIDGVVDRSGALTATEIEINDIVNLTSELWIVEGIISDIDEENKTFDLNDTEVDFSAVDVDGLKFKLENDLHVEVTGSDVNAILVAESITARYGDLDIDGKVTGHDLENKIITVEVIAGQPIIINYDSRTLIEDKEEDEDNNVDASSILVGDFVKIDAMDDSGTLLATIVKRETLQADDTFIIKAYVTTESINSTAKTITLLNTTFNTSSSTEYELLDETIVDQDEFFNTVKAGDFVSIRDESINFDWDGVAERAQIREP